MDNKKVNRQINANRVMVIGFDGEKLGSMPINIAVSKAQNQGYDLVEVSSKSNPPVCKIMDYGKYQFDQRKLDRKNKAKNKIHLKEIRMKTVIADHDLTTKMKRCLEFLIRGDKVKVSIQVNNRIKDDTQHGYDLIERITEIISDTGKLMNKPTLSGRYIDAMYSPIN